MRAGRKTQTYNISRTSPFSPNPVVGSAGGRNLEKFQLGGVIFGCKNSTMKECQSKQLFGLPAQHFSYVKNIDPGLPVFLFNFSDRKLHGIFEATSKGQMYIDPYAWIEDCSALDRTLYPAQVKFRVRLYCQPLSEDKFVQVIADNYYTYNHFWFELDHRQTSRLMSLLASLAFASGCNMKWISQSLPSTMKEVEAFERPHSETQHFTSSKTDSTEITSVTKSLASHAVMKEVDENEMNLITMKLKELLLARESEDLSMPNNVNDTPDENDMCPVEEDYPDVPADLEENKEEISSPAFEYQNTIGQLMDEIEELKAYKKMQIQKNCHLEKKLMEAEMEIQNLKDRCTILESAYNLPRSQVEKKVIHSSPEQYVDSKESLFSIRGFNGESCLTTMDLYSPSWNVIKFLYPMNSVTSIVQLNVESYSPILEKWTLWPSLNEKKESLDIVSLINKIFAVSGANVVSYFSDTDVFDLDIGRWISCTCSMLEKRFACAAVELNGLLYATGAENGIEDLKFTLGGFNKSNMVLNTEMFDMSFGAWMMRELMNHPFCCYFCSQRIYICD